MGYSPCKMADFQNSFISQILAVYSSRFFFAQKTPHVVVESFLHVFANFSFLTQTGHFAKAIYSLCKMADFQNNPISRIFSVFLQRFFAHNNSNMVVESFFAFFRQFYFLN